MQEVDVRKFRELEKTVMRLEDIIKRLEQRVEYLERERLRIKNDIQQLSSSVRK